MGHLYLVRHGQASFGAEDYDQLSAMGQQQSVRLGHYWRDKGLTFDTVLTGTLQRQRQTYAAICEGLHGAAGSAAHEAASVGASCSAGPTQAETTPSGGSAAHEVASMGASGSAGPPQAETTPSGGSAAHEVASVGAIPLLWPGLNEFDSLALIATVHPYPLPKPDTPELYRHHFRLLRDGLTQWMNGVVSPVGMPSYREFRHGVVSALDHIRKNCDGHVLIVSSGGPIATAIGHVLGTSPETTIELNMRLRNCAVTEFAFNPKRHTLLTFNTLAHLDQPEHASWITHA